MQPQLAVRFAKDSQGRTYVARQRATHPFHLCRPLYRPDDPRGLATLYLQGCAGGLFEGDRLALELRVEEGAAAHVTTAAATIAHRMPDGGHAEQTLRLAVGTAALLEYFPDPLILFSASRTRSRVVIELAEGARMIVIDSFLPHRLPDADRPFDWFESTLQIENLAGTVLSRERFRADGARFHAGGVGVTGLSGCQGGLLVLGAGTAPLGPLRTALSGRSGVMAGVSVLPEETGVMARLLGMDGALLRAALQVAWAAARSSLGIAPGRARPK
jgi:urease accessory protein